MTALSIAQRLGYISVVEELKVVTETTVSIKQESTSEERYKVQPIDHFVDELFLIELVSSDRSKRLKSHTKNIH